MMVSQITSHYMLYVQWIYCKYIRSITSLQYQHGYQNIILMKPSRNILQMFCGSMLKITLEGKEEKAFP